MNRVKHTDKESVNKEYYSNLTVDERLKILANIIVDKIIEDHKNGIRRTGRKKRYE